MSKVISSVLNKYRLLPVILLLVFDTIAMSYITDYAYSNKTLYIIPAAFFEVLAWIALVFMLRHRGLGVSNAIWDIGSLVLVTLIAVLQFKEKLVTRHYVGIILGIISISLLVKKE